MLQVQEKNKFWEEAQRQDSLENERLEKEVHFEKRNKDILVSFTGILIFTPAMGARTSSSLHAKEDL